MTVTLIGGPFDGEVKAAASPPAFVYAEGGGGFVRFFRSPKPGRLLYRRAERARMVFAQFTYAECCEAFHRRPEHGPWVCALCGASLRPM